MVILCVHNSIHDFSLTLAHLLEHPSIKEPEAHEWTMIAVINIGTLLKYSRPQGVLRRTDVLSHSVCHHASHTVSSRYIPLYTTVGYVEYNPGCEASKTAAKTLVRYPR